MLLSNKSFALIHAVIFVVVLTQAAAAAEGEAPKEGNEVGAEWQGGEQVRPGLPPKARV